MLPILTYPTAAKSDTAIAILELVIDGWTNHYVARGVHVQPNDVERELRAMRESGFAIERPPNTQQTFIRAIGIADIVSRYEFHTMKEMGFTDDASRKTAAGKSAEQAVVAAIAKSPTIGRSELWVRAVILLYREHVIAPARMEIDGGKKTVAELVRAA